MILKSAFWNNQQSQEDSASKHNVTTGLSGSTQYKWEQSNTRIS